MNNKNTITFSQYRTIDLIILSVLLVISEALATAASTYWFRGQPVAIVLTLTFICIFAMRWTWLSAIAAVLGALTFCTVSGAEAYQYAIYIVGNLFSLFALPVLKLSGKDEVRRRPARLILFTAISYFLMQLGRWLVSLIFEPTIRTLPVFLTTEALSLVFSFIILLVLSKQDGMLEDQKKYLFRLERERREEEQNADDEY